MILHFLNISPFKGPLFKSFYVYKVKKDIPFCSLSTFSQIFLFPILRRNADRKEWEKVERERRKEGKKEGREGKMEGRWKGGKEGEKGGKGGSYKRRERKTNGNTTLAAASRSNHWHLSELPLNEGRSYQVLALLLYT